MARPSIKDVNGDATLIRIARIEGISNAQLIQLFNDARAAEYKELAISCRASLIKYKSSQKHALLPEIEKHQRRFNEIQEIDYFKSPAAHDAQMLLHRLEKLLSPKRQADRHKLDPKQFQRRTWLTRPRPGIDRAGSAWLIRNFIDPKARFVFDMDPSRHPNALPFDMADVEFSHHGDDCTFETLVKRFGIMDKAVRQIAEMVHDADLEDGKFQRSECIGINAVLSGWAKANVSDSELLDKGIECFEGLYQQLRK